VNYFNPTKKGKILTRAPFFKPIPFTKGLLIHKRVEERY
jgi:hypothetical protein